MRRSDDPAAEGETAATADNFYPAKSPKGVSARRAAEWISAADARISDGVDSMFSLVRSAYTELYAETKRGTGSNAIRRTARTISRWILDALETRIEELEMAGDGETARRIPEIGDWARRAHAMAVGSA